MNINHIIVHSLKKEQHQDQADIDVNLREEELPVDDRVIALLEGVRDVYTNKTGKAFGKLGDTRFFSMKLKKMYAKKNGFIGFTNIAMRELKGHIAAQPLATGGYILFADFDNDGVHYFMVVMLKSKDGLSFDDELKLMDAHHLELDRLHFAARVDVDAWQAGGDENNVSFVKGRASTSVTLYFKGFLGIEEFSESTKITQNLVIAATNYYRQELGLDNSSVEEHKKNIHDYCQKKHENEVPIYLDELSRYLDEDNPARFMEYAQNSYEIPNEFQVDKSRLRKFLRYSGQDKGVSISFTSEMFGSRVRYDPVADVLTINEVPKTLKNQLAAEMRHQQDNVEE